MESAQFKNSLENIIQIVKEEWEDLQKEVKNIIRDGKIRKMLILIFIKRLSKLNKKL